MQLNRREVGRQLVHFSGISLVYIIIAAGKDTAFIIAAILTIFLLLIGIYRGMRYQIRNHFKSRLLEQLEDTFFDFADCLDRKTNFPYHGAFMFYFSSVLMLALFPAQAAVAIAVLAVHDSISTLVGVHLGRHKIFYNKNKSVEGALSGFAAAFAACILLSNFSTAFIAALVGALVESLPLRIDDNLTIPFGVALALSLI